MCSKLHSFQQPQSPLPAYFVGLAHLLAEEYLLSNKKETQSKSLTHISEGSSEGNR